MKMITLLTTLICGSAPLCSVPISMDWNDYQAAVITEKPNFSGWCPDDKAKHIMNLILSNNCKVCVEVGIFGGSSFFPAVSALAYKNEGIAYAIDPWTNMACLEGYEKNNDDFVKYWGKVDLEKLMHNFINGMHKNDLDAHYCIMRMTSAQAYLYFA